MINFKDNKGITLSILAVTVIVLAIIAGTAAYTGMNVYEDAKEEAFIQELKIIQNAVNNEWSKIELESLNDEDNDGTIDYIYNLTWGKEENIPWEDIPSEASISLKNIIGEGNGFRYYTSDALKGIGINGINSSVLINFTTREVVSVNGLDGKHTLKEFNETTNYGNVAIEIDDVPIPNGFVYLTGNKNNGLVIKNVKDGNEFVWIPVDDIDVLKLNNKYDGWVGNEPGIITTPEWGDEGGGSGPDRLQINRKAILDEGYENTDNGLQQQFKDEYSAMKKSVETYGGFYIGRYETGWNEENGVVVSKEGTPMTDSKDLEEFGWKCAQVVYNSKIERETTKTTWYGLYAKQKELYNKNSNSSVVSGMIYGCQWDAIMSWMENSKDKTVVSYVTDSTGMGWYLGMTGNETHLTGKDIEGDAKNKVNNIYDLAGNYSEWTQEEYWDVYRVMRGGSYDSIASMYNVASRSTFVPDSYEGMCSSRLQLYIK